MEYFLGIDTSSKALLIDAHGEAKNSWLTGTAAWNYVAITQWILGVRPTYAGLQVAPVVPSAWKSFEVARSYRGVRYVVRVERKGMGNKVQLEVDGKFINGDIIPIPDENSKEVQVRVTLT